MGSALPMRKCSRCDDRRPGIRRASRFWVVALALLGVVSPGSAFAREPAPRGSPLGWTLLETGLELGTFRAPLDSPVGESRIHILRVDPSAFELRLLMSVAIPDGRSLSAREWCLNRGLVAAINAGMYQADAHTSIALMTTRTFTNNPRLTKANTVLAFERLAGDVPPVQIIDRTCQDFAALRGSYGSLVQGIRMISCDRCNVWTAQPRRWSAAVIGTDHQGRVLLIHVRSPYSMHDLTDMLLELPIDLMRLQYAEGGPEAQLFIRSASREFEFLGSYETGLFENDNNTRAWPVPNVIGIARLGTGSD